MWSTLLILGFVPLSMKFIVPGKINHYIWIGNCLTTGVIIYTGIMIIDLKVNQNLNRTYYLYIGKCLTFIIYEVNSVLELGFLTFMCDKTVGGTHMTLLGSISNIIRHFIETFSLLAVDYVPYEYFFYVVTVYMVVMLYYTKGYAMELDETPASEFKIRKDADGNSPELKDVGIDLQEYDAKPTKRV
jgi:hypothetical protein